MSLFVVLDLFRESFNNLIIALETVVVIIHIVNTVNWLVRIKPLVLKDDSDVGSAWVRINKERSEVISIVIIQKLLDVHHDNIIVWSLELLTLNVVHDKLNG